MRPSRLPPSGLLPSLLLLPLVAGCAASDEADGGDPLRAAMMEPGTMSRLTGADHGIELHKWLVDDDVAAFAAAVQTHADRDVLPGPVRERWARNGFRLVRVPLDELGGMLTTLGGASMNLTGWYGQIPAWQSVHELPMPREATTLAVHGRMRRIHGGRLTLLARGWTVPMETGPYLQLELTPAHTPPPRRGELLELLQKPQPGATPEAFADMAAEVAMELGYAYILTCERPSVSWTVGAATDDDVPPPPPPDDPDATASGVGPDVVAPPTLGQFMLSSRAAGPSRGVLVFVPRIPPEEFPPDLVSELTKK